jgi:hypothetical protein
MYPVVPPVLRLVVVVVVVLVVMSVTVGGCFVAPMTIPDWPWMVMGLLGPYVLPRTSLYSHPLSGSVKVTESLYTFTTARPLVYCRK